MCLVEGRQSNTVAEGAELRSSRSSEVETEGPKKAEASKAHSLVASARRDTVSY